MIVKAKDGKILPHTGGSYGKVLVYGGKLMLTEYNFEKGSEVGVHSHPHEQISYIVKGKLIFTKGDKEIEVKAGDSLYFAPNEKHGARALEESKVVDTFTPQREDFLEKLGISK